MTKGGFINDFLHYIKSRSQTEYIYKYGTTNRFEQKPISKSLDYSRYNKKINKFK